MNAPHETREAEAAATRRFVIMDELCGLCGELLYGDLIEKTVRKICDRMESGPESWAFKERKE
jgi:hypothetical protein